MKAAVKDLFIAIAETQVKLKKLDFGISTEIYKGLNGNQTVFEVKPEFWNSGQIGLPYGTKAVYVSGYSEGVSVNASGNIQLLGEMAQFRTDLAGQQKSYRTILVTTGDNSMFYGREYKDYSGHYYSGQHPTGDIWAKVHPVRRACAHLFT